MNSLDLFYLPAAVVTAPWWARKTRSGWSERFGRIEPLPERAAGVKRVLLHAVSVGEVNTLRGLVPLLTERGIEVVVSVSTDTGLARARALFANQPRTFVVRYALDFSPAVNRFLDAVRPDAAALVELEVWPNFVAECARRSIPVCVINGRLSARSFRGYHRLRRFFRSTFGSLAFAAVQDSAYAERFRAMGVPENRVHITGSMKWDATAIVEPGQTIPGAEELARELGIDRSKPLVVAGSTAPIESGQYTCEEALLAANIPEGVQLLCAPRKPEHFDAAFAALGGPDRCIRRSTSSAARPGTKRFLLDTIGELRLAYALADVAIIGRSFGSLGGSDPIEPIALSKPTLIGPVFTNFQSVVETFRSAGAIEVCTADQVGKSINTLLNDAETRSRMIAGGLRCIHEQQGATRRHAEMLMQRLGSSKAG